MKFIMMFQSILKTRNQEKKEKIVQIVQLVQNQI